MSLKISTTLRNARLDALESGIGTSPVLRIFSGSAPANCAAADSGTKLVEMNLPSDWMAAAVSGSKGIAGTWSGNGITNGTAGYFRIYDSTATTCHLQGTCGMGSGDMQLDNSSIAMAQLVTVTNFTINDGN
jgi:hypothetical protein